MTAPLRRFLLNRQIAIEARKIAHEHTKTCKVEGTDGTDFADEHTPRCNSLKHQIETLAMQVKLAGLQVAPVSSPADALALTNEGEDSE